MTIHLVLLITLLNHTSFKGAKMLVSLDALRLGASPFVVGLLFSLFSLLPLFLAIVAGRVSDRYGPRGPMLLGATGLSAGLFATHAWPGLSTLFVATVLIGGCYIFHTVPVQHAVGTLGSGAERTRNYSFLALANGLTTLTGPTATGFAIDVFGHQQTYLLLGGLPVLTVLLLVRARGTRPAGGGAPAGALRAGNVELLKSAPLRRALIVSGIIETGLELFQFYLPLYGHSIGMSASAIGSVMGVFGAALLIARAVMPALARRAGEEGLLAGSLAVAALSLCVFPFAHGTAALAGISFVLGLGLGCCTPLAMTLTYNRAPSGAAGAAMGLRQTVNKFTEIMVPIAFGTLGAAFGLAPAFWLDAALLGTGVALMRGEHRRRHAA